MIPATTPLVGFSGEIIWSLGQISLLVKICDEEHSTSAWMNFMVVRSPSPYNGIIGRPRVKRIRAVPSMAHRILKFLVTGGTATLQSNRIILLNCIMVSELGIPQPVIDQVREKKIQVAIHLEYPEQTIAIGSTLTEEGRKELCGLLRRNLDIFAWRPADMTRVPRHIAEHRLNIREGCLPVRQKKRGWLSNPVMVKKHDGSWRMCVDFKDLNKACPKDGYPLPEIDWKGTFLGYKVDADRLKVCPEKVEAVLSLQSPSCLKDVQKLNGKLASLNIFLSKSAEKSLPFFRTLKKCTKKSDFQWTAEAETAFKQMKKLIMYLAAAKEATSTVLMTERDGKQIPRTSVKGQILADFIVERLEEDPIDTKMKDKEELLDLWVLFTDGSSCIDGSGAGLIITNPEGVEFTYALMFRFNATNNEAEYEALIAGLRIAEQIGVKNLQANVDSKLVANQVNGVYVAKEPGMIKYLEKVKNLAGAFKEFSIKQVPRGENKKADALSKMTSTSFAHLSKQVLVEELKEKSIDEKEVLAVVEEEGNTWMTPKNNT
ncbi:reverse transcriptase domain-containing protein [Tanacetum coccineum]